MPMALIIVLLFINNETLLQLQQIANTYPSLIAVQFNTLDENKFKTSIAEIYDRYTAIGFTNGQYNPDCHENYMNLMQALKSNTETMRSENPSTSPLATVIQNISDSREKEFEHLETMKAFGGASLSSLQEIWQTQMNAHLELPEQQQSIAIENEKRTARMEEVMRRAEQNRKDYIQANEKAKQKLSSRINICEPQGRPAVQQTQNVKQTQQKPNNHTMFSPSQAKQPKKYLGLTKKSWAAVGVVAGALVITAAVTNGALLLCLLLAAAVLLTAAGCYSKEKICSQRVAQAGM